MNFNDNKAIYLQIADRLSDDILQFVSARIPEHQAANRRYLTIAIGCTGGRHRSVYLAERIAERLSHN
jgi:UPF0042 nucleotide-binding protein